MARSPSVQDKNPSSRPSFESLLEAWKKSSKAQRTPLLQRWEHKIRANPCLLPLDQLAALRDADFPFTFSDGAWIIGYLAMSAFIQKHGHARVPMDKKSPLSSWVAIQRLRKRKGTLPPSRERALNRLGFIWNAIEAVWIDRITALTGFMRLHGHMDVPRKNPYETLAHWVNSTRGRKEELSPKKIRELDQIGFVWSCAEDRWQKSLQALQQFIQIEGHADVPAQQRSLASGFLLQMRKLYREGRLGKNRQKELESMGVRWNPQEEDWETRYQELHAIHRRVGHLYLPDRPEYKQVKRWLRRQREKPHRLSEDQRNRLIALDSSIFVKRPVGWRGWKLLITLILPAMNAQAMNYFLAEISQRHPHETLLMVYDGAPCHTLSALNLPHNILLLMLPPHSPELNPVEAL